MLGVLQPARQCGALPLQWNGTHLLRLRCAISLLILRCYTQQSSLAQAAGPFLHEFENGPADA